MSKWNIQSLIAGLCIFKTLKNKQTHKQKPLKIENNYIDIYWQPLCMQHAGEITQNESDTDFHLKDLIIKW